MVYLIAMGYLAVGLESENKLIDVTGEWTETGFRVIHVPFPAVLPQQRIQLVVFHVQLRVLRSEEAIWRRRRCAGSDLGILRARCSAALSAWEDQK